MFNFRHLFRRKIRIILTLLGIAIGVSVFTASTAAVRNFRNETVEMIKGKQIDLIVMSRNASTPIFSHIPTADVDQIARLNFVRQALPLLFGTIKTEKNPYFALIGMTAPDNMTGIIVILDGGLFDPTKNQIMLGRIVARRLAVKTGDEIILAGERFIVSGLFASGHAVVDGAAIMDIDLTRRLLSKGDQDSVTAVLIRLKPGLNPKTAACEINQRFPHLSAVRGTEILNKLRIMDLIDSMTAVISSLSLLACALIVMNTLLMAVTERTQEMGILMAVGWSRLRVVRLILSEALVLAALGIIIGDLCGWLMLWWFSKLQSVGYGWIPVAIPFDVLLFSAVLTLFASAVGAFYPAFWASRLNPAEALRHE